MIVGKKLAEKVQVFILFRNKNGSREAVAGGKKNQPRIKNKIKYHV